MYINPSRKLLRHLDRLDALRQGRVMPPINIEIDLSNRCSLGCEWCHFAHTHTRGPLQVRRTVETGDLMDTDLALRVVRDLEEYGIRSLVWSGGGEPTLHPDLGVLVEATRIPQGMYTNGAQISEPLAALLKRRLAWVYVSLDAMCEADYYRDKGVDRFDAVCAGIRRLAQAPGRAIIGVGFLIGKHNWTAARTMSALGRVLGADYVQLRPIVQFDPQAPSLGSGDWVTGHVLNLLSDIAQAPEVEIDLTRFERLRDWQGHGYNTCWWSRLQSVITPDGRVWDCLNKRGMGEPMGDLTTESFPTIWERGEVARVTDQCRIMCRGHIPNLALDDLMQPVVHEEFV